MADRNKQSGGIFVALFLTTLIEKMKLWMVND